MLRTSTALDSVDRKQKRSKFQIKDIWASIGTVAHAQEHVIEKCYNVVQRNIMLRSQTQKALQQKKSTNKKNSPEVSTTTGKKTPSRKNPAKATRKRANDKNAPKPKRAKTMSATEGRPLTTADIPDIIAAVADANRRKTSHETPVQAKKSRRTPNSGSNASPASHTRSRLSKDDSPSGDSQPSSDEDNEEDAAHAEFGKYIHTIKNARCISFDRTHIELKLQYKGFNFY